MAPKFTRHMGRPNTQQQRKCHNYRRKTYFYAYFICSFSYLLTKSANKTIFLNTTEWNRLSTRLDGMEICTERVRGITAH